MEVISIHAPTKGATIIFLKPSLTSYISIHAPTKGATNFSPDEYPQAWISIHAPTKGATYSETSALRYLSDFNPRSHEGSDAHPEKCYPSAQNISIHAPTKGATVQTHLLVGLSGISIHAPTKGATKLDRRGPLDLQDFNPRSHEGSDENLNSTSNRPCNFNPRSHEGSDMNEDQNIIQVGDFNPRSHEGSDSNFDQKFIPLFDKNHKLSFSKLNFPFPIHSFFQNTLHLCTFQGANSSTISCPLPIRTLTLSQN